MLNSSQPIVSWQQCARGLTSLLASAPGAWQPHDAPLAHAWTRPCARHASSGGGSHSPRRRSQQQPPHDEYYRTPTEAYAAPQSEGQRRLSSRMEAILSETLSSNASFRDSLVDPFGLCVQRARLSPDRRTLSVLWDCFPNKADACAQRLERVAPRLQVGETLVDAHRRAAHLHLDPELPDSDRRAWAAVTQTQVPARALARAGFGSHATLGKLNFPEVPP
jgi:hypothetical protein